MKGPMRSLFGMLIGFCFAGVLFAPARMSAAVAASPSATPTFGVILHRLPTPTPSPAGMSFPPHAPLLTPMPIGLDYMQINCTTTALIPIYGLSFAVENQGTRFAHPIYNHPTQVRVDNPLPGQLKIALQQNSSRIPVVLSYCIGRKNCFYGNADLVNPVYTAHDVAFTIVDATDTGGPMDPKAPGFVCPSPSPTPSSSHGGSGSGGAPVSGHGSSGTSPVAPQSSPSASP